MGLVKFKVIAHERLSNSQLMERSSESPGHKSDIEQKKNYKTIDLELQETIRTITTSITELKNYCGSISSAIAQLT